MATKPFKIPEPLRTFSAPYPPARELLEMADRGGEAAQHALARLWLSEGIPAAFRECPALYEAIRTYIGTHLDVHPKEVSLSGSGRLGTSLAPKKIDKPFDIKSDLDFFSVSNKLFENLRQEFCTWSRDYECGNLRAGNDREAGFWEQNSHRGHKLIGRGFLDSWLIPNLEPYTVTSKISQVMWLVTEKLGSADIGPKPQKATLRCYCDWDSFIAQTVVNIKTLARQVRNET